MQEAVSGYGFRIFQHSSGGGAGEPAAWGFHCPASSVPPGSKGLFPCGRMGSAQQALALVLGGFGDSPAPRPEKGTPETPCGSGRLYVDSLRLQPSVQGRALRCFCSRSWRRFCSCNTMQLGVAKGRAGRWRRP